MRRPRKDTFPLHNFALNTLEMLNKYRGLFGIGGDRSKKSKDDDDYDNEKKGKSYRQRDIDRNEVKYYAICLICSLFGSLFYYWSLMVKHSSSIKKLMIL